MRIVMSVALLAILVFSNAYAEYPVLTSSQDRCLADIRVAPPVRNLDPSTYPNVPGSPGPVSAGQQWTQGEGYTLCVRLSGNCQDYANSFYCVSASRANEGQPLNGTF